MDWLTALLGVGGSLLGGLVGQQGADKASQQQQKMIQKAIDFQQQNLGTGVNLIKDATGRAVQQQNAATTDTIRRTNAATNESIRQQNVATDRSVTGANNATRAGIGDQQRALTGARTDLMPWLQAGRGALAQYQGELGLSKVGADGQPFKSGFRETPGYQFAVQQGEKGAVNNLRSLGMGASGAALKALTRFRTGLADQTYGQYMDRLNGVSTNGQAAATHLGDLGVQTGANIANYRQNGAQMAGNYRMGGAANNNGTIMNGAGIDANARMGGASANNSTIMGGATSTAGLMAGGGQNIADNLINLGTAQAGGTVGGTNSWLNALGNGMNNIGRTLGSGSWDFLKTAGNAAGAAA